jgi:cell fate regulator YaaT (PSP1 superfamily)
MAQTIEVRFKGNRRGFYDWLDQDAPLKLNEPVLVEAERGLDFGYVNTTGDTASAKCGGCDSCGVPDPAGTVVKIEEETIDERRETRDEAPVLAAEDPSAVSREPSAPATTPTPASKPRVARRASAKEIEQHRELRRDEDDVRRKVIERVKSYDLGMRISDAEWQWDRGRLTLYFTAERRVDFRKLVRELASTFRTRIELRQIGVRDEAARLGGIGRCGREFCCSTWLTEPGPVNLALAKDQHLSLNPSQISGGCGRLLCCLKYEHDFYLASRKRYPKEGKLVRTMLGAEKVIAVDIFRERVSLRSDEHGMRTIPVLDLRDEMERAPAATDAPAAQPAAPAPSAPRQQGTPPAPRQQGAAPADKNRGGPRRPPRGGQPPRSPQ